VCPYSYPPTSIFIGSGQLRENTPSPSGMNALRIQWEDDMWKMEGEPPQGGVSRSPGGSFRAAFHQGDCQVGPNVGMGVFVVFVAHLHGEVGPWIRILVHDWSKVCFLGSMRCHGHVDSCVTVRRHVAWCGSHQAHVISCAYLLHPNTKVGK
jgi:hypothetical protein